MRLTAREACWVMDLLRERYGPGYSDAPGIGALQAKLSILAEFGRTMGDEGPTVLPEKAVAPL